ncbi:MAG: DUF5333 domain-containing protein [Sulfitobacter sp.]|nr:DUF5333 domain-containing protein [Sulfitobacter sp.]
MRAILTVILTATLMAGAAQAKPPLREVAEIDDALFDLGLADRIRKECPSIDARLLRALGYVSDLKNRAEALGYSSAEIDAYTDSDADKDRLRAKAAAFFAARGVDTSNPQSYCAVGLEEIQKESRIGSLLRAK